MSVIIGNLHKKKIVRNMSGQIIDLLDETDGGWIIKNKVVVNQEKWDAMLKKEKDRIEATKINISNQTISKHEEDRDVAPSKQQEMQKEIDELKAMVKDLIKKK